MTRDRGGGDSSIRVGFVLARYPVLSETFILRELHAFWRRGVGVSIFAFGGSPDALSHPMVEELDAPLVVLPREGRRVHIARAFRFWLGRAPRRLLRALRQAGGGEDFRASMGALYLAQEACAHAPHHFHAHYLTGPSAGARTMAVLHGVSFSVTAHAHDIFLSEPSDLARRIRQAAWVRTISRYNRRLLRGMASVPSRRVEVIRVGIDLAAHAYRAPDPHPHPVRIATVGRLVPIKGMDVLLRAIALLPRERWRLSIVGSGPLEGSLRALARALGIAASVRFEGPLVQEAVRDLLARTDLFVLASQRDSEGNMDGLPIVLVEALAMGVPAVASAISGIPELLGGGAGLLVPPGDPEALAQAMARLMDDGALRLRCSVLGRRRVERGFDLATCSTHLIRRFERLCRGGLDPSGAAS